MFDKFFKKKKENDIDLKKQLEVLVKLGISLNPEVTVHNLLKEMKFGKFVSNDYLSLLIVMGCEFQNFDNICINFSNNIWYLDTECIEDNGDYIRVVERLIAMANGELKINNLNDYIDIENKEAKVYFELNEKLYNWELVVDDDWLDMNIFSKFNDLLSELNSDKKFYVSAIDQSILVGIF
jgi:hypothetical protein